jgi:hypothetical protein
VLALAKVVRSRQETIFNPFPMLHVVSGLPQPLPWISSGKRANVTIA